MEEKNIMKYHSEEYIVAFIDVLGASAAMKENPDLMLNQVHEAYEHAIKTYNNVYGNKYDEIGIRIFSDNIVIFCKCYSDAPISALSIVVTLAATIQLQFLHQGILSRGGIAKGDFFNDDVMIWGNALVKSYYLEDKIAIYPRIIIDNNSIVDVNGFFNSDSKVAKALKEDFILQDKDGLFYVNYLNMVKGVSSERLENEVGRDIDEIKSIIISLYYDDACDKRDKHQKDIKLIQKINWHLEYLSRYISENNIVLYPFDEEKDNV